MVAASAQHLTIAVLHMTRVMRAVVDGENIVIALAV